MTSAKSDFKLARALLDYLLVDDIFRTDLFNDVKIAKRLNWETVGIEYGHVREKLRRIGLMDEGEFELNMGLFSEFHDLAVELAKCDAYCTPTKRLIIA
jgi:hypothetical protein